jgi:hypothetical protein
MASFHSRESPFDSTGCSRNPCNVLTTPPISSAELGRSCDARYCLPLPFVPRGDGSFKSPRCSSLISATRQLIAFSRPSTPIQPSSRQTRRAISARHGSDSSEMIPRIRSSSSSLKPRAQTATTDGPIVAITASIEPLGSTAVDHDGDATKPRMLCPARNPNAKPLSRTTAFAYRCSRGPRGLSARHVGNGKPD